MPARRMGPELNELYVPEVHFEFPFSLMAKLTMAFLTGQSWYIIKSWYTGGGPEHQQGFRHWLTDGLTAGHKQNFFVKGKRKRSAYGENSLNEQPLYTHMYIINVSVSCLFLSFFLEETILKCHLNS